jgi:DNA-binding response OmpR family regulator
MTSHNSGKGKREKLTVKKSILFIEDEEELLFSIARLLRETGYHVDTVTDAEHALLLLRDSKPDLILADIKLPGIDGFDLFHEVRKDIRLKSVPVIFITAFNNVKAMMYAKKIGVDEYITKPFEFEYLIARIRALVS